VKLGVFGGYRGETKTDAGKRAKAESPGFDIWRVGRPKSQGGSGTAWQCSCPRGADSMPPNPDRLLPCRHLTQIFTWAKEHAGEPDYTNKYGDRQMGHVHPQFKLTAPGRTMAKRCQCNGKDEERMPPVPMRTKKPVAPKVERKATRPEPMRTVKPKGRPTEGSARTHADEEAEMTIEACPTCDAPHDVEALEWHKANLARISRALVELRNRLGTLCHTPEGADVIARLGRACREAMPRPS
jgi:hypothetical protein